MMNDLEAAGQASWAALREQTIINSFHHIKWRADECLRFNGRRFEGEQHPIEE